MLDRKFRTEAKKIKTVSYTYNILNVNMSSTSVCVSVGENGEIKENDR